MVPQEKVAQKGDPYDASWKDAMDALLPQMMELFYPEAHAEIDWSFPFVSLNTELRGLFAEGDPPDRRADGLYQVRRKTGGEQWLIIHTEAQSTPDQGLARRMLDYCLRCFQKFEVEVAGYAILPHLRSAVAFVVDQDTDEVLFSKNAQSVQPIASITKLMTALVVMDAAQRLDEVLTISEEDIDTEKGSHSRLSVGTQLTRGEMLHLALMSSENRAANALGRHYPGGLGAFVDAMNTRAATLGMIDTHYVEPTGLSSRNRSSARDLVLLVKEAHQQPLLRELSTSHEAQVQVGRRALQYRNTNGLVRSPQWEIGLQKTGYIAEAGRCLVMQAQLAGRKLIMVLLDSAGKYTRIGDAERIRRWLSQQNAAQVVASGTRS